MTSVGAKAPLAGIAFSSRCSGGCGAAGPSTGSGQAKLRSGASAELTVLAAAAVDDGGGGGGVAARLAGDAGAGAGDGAAAAAFIVSLAGLAANTLSQLGLTEPSPHFDSGADLELHAAIWAVAIALLVYALRMRARGVLR